MPTCFAPPDDECSALALQLMLGLHDRTAEPLVEPGPDATQIQTLFEAAASAPDHGQITPWRFVVIAPDKRERLLCALQTQPAPLATPLDAMPLADAPQAWQAPFLALAIARLGPSEPDIAPLERLVSLGAAVQNLLLMAHAMGFGARLGTDPALSGNALRALLELAPTEQAVCFVHVGTRRAAAS